MQEIKAESNNHQGDEISTSLKTTVESARRQSDIGADTLLLRCFEQNVIPNIYIFAPNVTFYEEVTERKWLKLTILVATTKKYNLHYIYSSNNFFISMTRIGQISKQ